MSRKPSQHNTYFGVKDAQTLKAIEDELKRQIPNSKGALATSLKRIKENARQMRERHYSHGCAV
jgi:hypothetical protein